MITHWPNLYSPAEGGTAPDRALIERAKAPRTYARKGDVPRCSGGEFRGNYRSLATFVRLFWLALDFDEPTTRDQIVEAFGDLYGVAHTTWTEGRWRVWLVLSRAVDGAEDCERVWRAGAAHAERYGLAPDYGAKSPAHCFALPARHNGAAYEHVELTGAFFDVDEALTTIPKPTPMPVPTPMDHADGYGRRLERAAKYLSRMPGGIQGSGGSTTTFRAAVAMILGFALDVHERDRRGVMAPP